MPVNAQVKGGKHGSAAVPPPPTTPLPSHTEPTRAQINGLAPPPASSGKKKKKKKAKAKNASGNNNSNGNRNDSINSLGGGVENPLDGLSDEEDLPGLEVPPGGAAAIAANARASLPPDLEAVHLSASASLASLSKATLQLQRDVNGLHNLASNGGGGGNGTTTSPGESAPFELLAELYKKACYDAPDVFAEDLREVREGLNALPSGMKKFVQNALASGFASGLESEKHRTLYKLAQQLLESGLVGEAFNFSSSNNNNNGNNNGRTNGTGTGTGKTPMGPAPPPPPGMPDVGALSDFALSQTLERLVSGKGMTVSGRDGQTALHASVVLSRGFDGEGEYDDAYSDDGLDGDGMEGLEMRMDVREVHHHTHTHSHSHSHSHHRHHGLPLDGVAGQFSVSYEEELLPVPGSFPLQDEHDEHEHGGMYDCGHGPDGTYTSPRKRNKKKKKKAGSNIPYLEPEPEYMPSEPGDVTPVTATVNSSHPMQPTLASTRTTTSTTTTTPMPPTRNAANPPPSSRAAGKQPMSYSPAPPQTANTQATGTPPRSARAAAKAPAPPQTYTNHNHAHHHPSPPSSNASAPQKHRPPGSQAPATPAANNPKANSKIWSTNTTEERERIKEFWLGLSEKERRDLVKIEKETVLKKMKEQQKHSCTCAVCGRKRNAIEEELEVLYDAYYEELEQYANYQQQYASSGGKLAPPPGPGPFPGSVELDKNGVVVGPGGRTQYPPRQMATRAAHFNNGKKGVALESEFDEEDPDGDEYEDDYDDEEEEDEEDEEEDVEAEEDVDVARTRRRGVPGGRDRARVGPNGVKANGRDELFNFGSNLTVAGPGDILTVADDLLKNDGQKFLEMMEQLAERRMQREEEAAADIEDDSEEDEDDEGVDEDEDDEEDDEDDDEEELTEEQRMEEGKRMFSIFAARMFEQRVLTAYREKVAQERQLELLREEEAEKLAKKEREAKKAKENQKKKDKKKQQKLAKEGEKAQKAAERAAEEAEAKRKQQQLEEERKKKQEEERTKREAARKAAEEEKARKEEERRKRLAEEKEQHVEREKKRKEKEERARAERREREEKERRIREEREAKLAAERAAEKAKKEQEEKERLEQERLRKEEQAKLRAAKQEEQKQQQQQRAAAAKARTPASPRTNQAASGSRQAPAAAAAPKKILSKPSTQSVQSVQPTPAAPAPTSTRQQPPRPIVAMQQPATPVPSAPPVQSQHSSPTASSNVPTTPVFPHALANNQIPPAISPRTPFPPAPPGMSGFAPYMAQMQAPSLGPSALPRGFGGAPPFEPGFGRGLAPAAPIGPPPKVGLPNPIASPIMAQSASVSSRRMSAAADPGPITRPIAPIARPTTTVNGDSTSASGSGSGGASPSRRSPSPKVLGSAALLADDDEVVSAPGRRAAPPAPVGQSWHSPRGSIAAGASPWGPMPPTPAFASSPRVMPGAANAGLNIGGLWAQAGAPGMAPPPSAGLPDWPMHANSHFFGGAPPFVHPNHPTASPPPHTSGN